MPVKGIAAAALAATLLLDGCAARHRFAPSIHLEELAGIDYLVPGRSTVSEGDRQLTKVRLGRLGSSTAAACVIHGTLFGLEPPAAGSRDVWTITSPGMRGWQALPSDVDFRSEWMGFLRALAALQEHGCFRSGSSLIRAQQTIAQSITLPSDDALVFAYSFTGTEAIDLVPDMQVQVEHSIYVSHDGQRELQTSEGDYRVVASSGGVALSRTRVITSHKAETQDEIFHLNRLTRNASMLRLFLQSVATGDVRKQPILLASSNAASLIAATQRMQASDANGCVGIASPDVRCIAFPSAVSLLLSCRFDGNVEYRAPGTALSQLLDEKRVDLASVTMRRRQTDGSYAALLFPLTKEAAAHVLLQNGDRITTH